MKSEIIVLVEELMQGGHEARALGYSIFTEANSLKDLKENVRDAVLCHFEEKHIPRCIRLHFVKDEFISV
ncbi:MAG: 2-oxoisovalerate dehydrogenase [Atribacterota bacterium]